MEGERPSEKVNEKQVEKIIDKLNEKYNEKNPTQLKIDEIVEYIQKLGFPKIDKNIIESNDSDVVVELFSSLLEKLGIIKKDKLKIHFQGMEHFSYTGLHDRPIYILKLFNSINKFVCEILGVEDFSSSDLFTPTSKRTKKILSGIIKFFKFKQSEKETHLMMKENLENSIAFYNEHKLKAEKAESIYIKLK
jgi:hypothetical protein